MAMGSWKQPDGRCYIEQPAVLSSGIKHCQKLCMPTIAYVVNDTPERKLLTLVGDSAKQPRPCSACTIAKDDLAKGDVSCDYVTNDRHRRMGMDSKRFVLRTAAQVAAAPTRGASSTKKKIIDESWQARAVAEEAEEDAEEEDDDEEYEYVSGSESESK